MRENKLVISAPTVSLSHKAGRSKAIPAQKGQLKFHIAKKTGRKETKMSKSSAKSPNALAEFGWLFHWQGQIAGRVRKAVGDQLGIWISHLHVSNTTSAGTEGFKCNFPRNKR